MESRIGRHVTHKVHVVPAVKEVATRSKPAENDPANHHFGGEDDLKHPLKHLSKIDAGKEFQTIIAGSSGWWIAKVTQFATIVNRITLSNHLPNMLLIHKMTHFREVNFDLKNFLIFSTF